jgi:hypothetical protein
MNHVLVAAALLAGCSNDLPASSHVDKLRVLAMRAEPPEVAPGQTATIDTLVVEPMVQKVDDLGAPKGPSYFWLACTIPPGAVEELPCGVDPSRPLPSTLPPTCDQAPTADLCLLGTTPTVTFTPSTARLGSDGTGQMLITLIVDDTDRGALGCLEYVIGQGGMPVTAAADTSSADHCVLAVKRLAISDPNRTLGKNHVAPPPPNRNPSITNLFFVDGAGHNVPLLDGTGGFTIAADGQSGRLTLAATRAEDAAEMEPQLDSNGKPALDSNNNLEPFQVEQLTVAWYVTGGSIEGGRSAWVPDNCLTQAECPMQLPISEAVTKWNPPTRAQLSQTSPMNDPRVRFWAVIRDDRGGVGWVSGTATP